MKQIAIAMALLGSLWLLAAAPTAYAAPRLIVTLTGIQSGPSTDNGKAGAGTLVRYGDDSNNCSALKLQFDAECGWGRKQ